MHLKWPSLALAFLPTLFGVTPGCGGGGDDDQVTTPYDGIPADQVTKLAGLDGPIDIVRDSHGIPHIYATTLDDVAFGQGYVMAFDRLPEMDLFRHVGAGRIAELYGALDQEQVDNDLEMRMHRMKPIAEEAYAQLQASTDPVDQAVLAYSQRMSDGINLYLTELKAGQHTVAEDVAVWFDPSRTGEWSVVDSMVIGRLQAWSLSYNADYDLRITDALQRSRAAFDDSADPDHARRAKAFFDLIDLRPMDNLSPIDGFPNVDTDTGSRAKPGAGPARAGVETRRPVVPDELLANALHTLRPKTYAEALVLRHPGIGSNNWVVGDEAGGGHALLANDTHMPLVNPTILYLIHLTVPGQLDVAGAVFPGTPGVTLGHNAHFAWGGTVVIHDVYDSYLETIAACPAGSGDCVTFNGQQVPIETWEETIDVGALGTITDSFTATYEMVPHHGPIVPTIVDHRVVPRAGGQGISVKYTGYEVTNEIRSIWLLNQATSVDDGLAALDTFGFGAQNWVMIDDAGNFAWTTNALVPWRTPGCFSYSEQNPDGVSPFLVLPGDGSCEWDGWMDQRYIPHSINPARGYIASANSDPVGATFDGDPLNGPIVDGRPLYVGALYDPGYREGEIMRRLEAFKQSGMPITVANMQSVQADTRSNYGASLRPHIAAAVAAMAEEIATPGAHPDLTAFVTALPAARRTRLLDAADRLAAWSLETPSAVEGAPTAAEIADSAATSIFNAWQIGFIEHALRDELDAVQEPGDFNVTTRTALALLERPTELSSGLAIETGEPILCDDLGTPGVIESCTLWVLVALDEGLDFLESPNGFGTTDPTTWRWGHLHRLTLKALVKSEQLAVPPPTETNPDWQGGFPRHGDNFSVDSSDPEIGDFDFSYEHGPAIRHVTTFTGPGEPTTKFALPGGESYDPRSPHYRDLMDGYWHDNTYFDFLWKPADIVGDAESRWRFDPL